MTTWSAARDAIAAILDSVAITVPVATSIKRVYTYRTGAETEFPCVVISSPPAKRVERGPGGYRAKTYDVDLHLMVRDAEIARAADILDAFEEAIIDAFDNAVALNFAASGYMLLSGPDWIAVGEPAPRQGSAIPVSSAHGVLTLRATEAKNYIG